MVSDAGAAHYAQPVEQSSDCQKTIALCFFLITKHLKYNMRKLLGEENPSLGGFNSLLQSSSVKPLLHQLSVTRD